MIGQQELKHPSSLHQQGRPFDRELPTYATEQQETPWGEANTDMVDMKRLGKKQEFKVELRSSSGCFSVD